MSFHKSNLGSFGEGLQSDMDGYVPEADDGAFDFNVDHGTERTHDEDSGWRTHRSFLMKTNKVPLCGLLVSPAVAEAAKKDWPKRVGIGYSDRTYGAACANHVLLVSREMGEEPETDPEAFN